MTLEDILHAMPSREDIAGAVGLSPRSSVTEEVITAFGIFGTGVILGAGLALLFAPKAGHEVRQDIAEKVSALGDHLRAQVPRPAAPGNGPTA